MKRSGVIKYLFMDHIVATYSHLVTGERFPYDERWNKINNVSDSERNKIYFRFVEDRQKLTKEEEEEKLLTTGWLSLDTGHWEPEKFEIN